MSFSEKFNWHKEINSLLLNFIHRFSSAYPIFRVTAGLKPIPAVTGREVGTPWTDPCSVVVQTQRNHSHSHSHLLGDLESPVNLTSCMSLDCRRKPGSFFLPVIKLTFDGTVNVLQKMIARKLWLQFCSNVTRNCPQFGHNISSL